MNTRIDIKDYEKDGYGSLVIHDEWRVAMLNYIDELRPEAINSFQAHSETDEVFILLHGSCILFTAEKDGESVKNIEAINMELYKVYNVPRGVYHTHTLSKDGKVLIVENENTSDANSPTICIQRNINEQLIKLTKDLWSK